MLLEEALAKYEHIPPELKSRPNWCIAGPDKNPYKMTASGVYMASNQKPEDWTTFEKAIEGMVATNAPAIGFCLRAGEDITCIDLDVKDKDNAPDKPHLWTTPEQMQRFIKIVEVFDTYTERSSSGKGVHLWLYGTVGAGAKRDGVEVYSQERFIVCTGDVYINKPLARRDEYLEMLVTEIRASARPEQNFSLVELEATESDEVVYQRAASAANADKFSRLFCGQWQGLYPSQSEADLALMSMFAYYSQSNESADACSVSVSWVSVRKLSRMTAISTTHWKLFVNANSEKLLLTHTAQSWRSLWCSSCSPAHLPTRWPQSS